MTEEELMQCIRYEEEEEREISEACLRLMYMRESCEESDREILGLLEEQQKLLNNLRMEKEEIRDEWEKEIRKIRN